MLVVDTVHLQTNMFVTCVKSKATIDPILNDSRYIELEKVKNISF